MTDFYYNITNLTQPNNTMVEVAQWINEVTGGVFWFATVFVIWIVMFVSFLPFGEKKSMLTSAFIANVYSYLLAAMGLMDISLSLIPTIILVFMAIFNIVQGGSN